MYTLTGENLYVVHIESSGMPIPSIIVQISLKKWIETCVPDACNDRKKGREKQTSWNKEGLCPPPAMYSRTCLKRLCRMLKAQFKRHCRFEMLEIQKEGLTTERESPTRGNHQDRDYCITSHNRLRQRDTLTLESIFLFSGSSSSISKYISTLVMDMIPLMVPAAETSLHGVLRATGPETGNQQNSI